MPNQEQERTKVVVRKLPPELTQEEFQTALDSILDRSRYSWFRFMQGKISLKRVYNSCAYLKLKDTATVIEFSAKINGRHFKAGNLRPLACEVQYAPFQKAPRARSRKDPREGTLCKDADFQSFKERLEAPPAPLPSAEGQLQADEKGSGSDAVVVTPLMEFIRQKYARKAPKPKVAAVKGAAPKEKARKGAAGEDGARSASRRGKENGKGPREAFPAAEPAPAARPDKGSAAPRRPKASDRPPREARAEPESGPRRDAPQGASSEAAPKVLLRKDDDGGSGGGSSRATAGERSSGTAAAPPPRPRSGKPERIREGHQAYVPRPRQVSAREAAEGRTSGPPPRTGAGAASGGLEGADDHPQGGRAPGGRGAPLEPGPR
uniref:Regulator of nonsense transcripts 3 n=1 Tax=Tetraselmis sp. GSL018 TaxID=582737 RepID=A0A061R8Y4_9CHLO